MTNPKSEGVRLAPVDIQIIRALQRDARGSLVKVAAALGVPESTVRNRVNRLVEKGLVEFAVATNPLRFGYDVWAIIQVQVQPAHIRSVARRLAQVPDIHLVGIMSGSYDIYAAALFRNNQELLDLITGSLARIPGIRGISTSQMLEVVKRNVTFGIPNGETIAPPTTSKKAKKRRISEE